MWIDHNIGWVLEISGLLTCSMLLYALAPRMVHEFVFGVDVTDNTAILALRSWGIMIFGAGALLVYAAYHPDFRDAIMLYSIAGKSSFILPVLFDSGKLLRKPAFAMALADVVMVALFAWYLVG
jgi:hypothetical protein